MDLYSRLTDNAKMQLDRYTVKYPNTGKQLRKRLEHIVHTSDLTFGDLTSMYMVGITKVLPDDHEIMKELEFVRLCSQNRAL